MKAAVKIFDPFNILKFADDATIVVFGEDTKSGVSKFENICSNLSCV